MLTDWKIYLWGETMNVQGGPMIKETTLLPEEDMGPSLRISWHFHWHRMKEKGLDAYKYKQTEI